MIPFAAHIAAAAVAGSLAFAAAWTAQGWRGDAALAQLQLDHERAAREVDAKKTELERTNAKKYQAAINAARADQARLAAAADAAAAESERLRHASAAAQQQLAAATPAAVAQYARTAAQLLGDCSAQYQALARAADGHAADAAAVIAAWPGD